MWAFECLDLEEALALLEEAPPGSHVELVEKEAGTLIILWVPVARDYLEAMLA